MKEGLSPKVQVCLQLATRWVVFASLRGAGNDEELLPKVSKSHPALPYSGKGLMRCLERG